MTPFRHFLLNTATPHAMHPDQMRDLQTQLGVMVLSWDGVAKAIKDAREKISPKAHQHRLLNHA